MKLRTGLPHKQRGNGNVLREDGWYNATIGLGDSNKDKRRRTTFKPSGRQTLDVLESLYRDGGMARRVIDLPANSMTRNWFKVTGERGKEVMQRLETLGAQHHITAGLKWADLYGGCVVLMGVADGQFDPDIADVADLTKPVNLDGIESVKFLQPYSAWREVDVMESSIDEDTNSETFGEPLIYRITKLLGGGSFNVHISRLLRFDGALLPRSLLVSNQSWHDSVFQAAFRQLRQVGSTYDSAEFIIQDFVQTIVKIKDLMNKIAAGQEDIVKKRINLIDLSRHVANTVLLDSEEEYERQSSTVTGLPDLLDRFMMALSAVTGIPVTLLMGRSPAGQNATGESDIRFWYDKVQADQNNVLKPRLEKLIRYLFLENGKSEPEEWSIQFNDLFQPTDKEEQELYKLTAEGDAVYISNGVLDPNEVAVSRFGGEEFDTGVVNIDEKSRKTEEPVEPEEIEEPEPPTDVPAEVPAGTTE